jgi:hypothetical protein
MLLKFLTGFLPVLILSTDLFALNLPKNQQVFWRYGEQVCGGRWSYNPINSCELPEHEAVEWESCEDKSFGDVWKFAEHKDCGVESYWSRKDAAICGTTQVCTKTITVCKDGKKDKEGFCPPQWRRELCTIYRTDVNSCEHSSFGVAKWKACRTEGNGWERYASAAKPPCKAIKWAVAYNRKCPTTDEVSSLKVNSATLTPTTAIAPALKNFDGLGSSCSSCDDIPVDTVDQRKAKFVCLQKSIENAWNSDNPIPGFDNPILIETVAAARALLAISEKYDSPGNPSLSEDDRSYILDTLAGTYPAFRYENPRYFPSTFEFNLLFQNSSGAFAIDTYVSDFGRRYGTKMPYDYGWRLVADSSGTEVVTANVPGTADLSPDLRPYNAYAEFVSKTGGNPAKWEMALPNGKYQVTVGVGDIGTSDRIHKINVEGVTVINNFKSSPFAQYTEGTVTVELKDGVLTIDAIGGTKSKISWLKIRPKS